MSDRKSAMASSSGTSLERLQGERKRRKASRVKLPTPPPDPSDAGKKEEEFLEYLEYLQGLQRSQRQFSRSTSAFAPAIAAEDAFDHLDKLYKLMEQMLTLREQNVLLHRRIMDLEKFRTMQDLKLEERVVHDYDPDAEHFLYNILAKQGKAKGFRQSILRKPLLQQRRNQSLCEDYTFAPYERRVSVAPSLDKTSKVSKWTKVKAAFKWEKASPTVSDAKSQDSGLGGMQPVNYEVARYLRVPSTSDDLGNSPADSCAAEISTPATLSSASSVEELHRQGRRKPQQDDSSDEEFTYDYIPVTKDDSSSKLSKRTPWAKMKDIIQTQTRSSFKKKRLSTKSDEVKEGSVGSDVEDVFESEEARSPLLVVQTPEEINKENQILSLEHNIPIDVIMRYRGISDENNRQISKWSKVKKAFLSSPSISRNDSNSPILASGSEEFPSIKRELHPTKESDEKLHAEIQKNYLQLQKKLSLEFQEKLQEWERSKLNTPTLTSTAPASPLPEDDKEIAFKKKMDEWERIRGPKQSVQLQSEENLPPEFRKKLEEWKRIKKSSVKEVKKRAKSGDEAERGNQTPSPRLSRKDGSGSSRERERKLKDNAEKELQWFEKELNKIEREKQRLERDRQKFLEREEKLSKLRRSVAGSGKKEILVHTPSGFYRFEGINRKFTQKLYEWEKAQGIGPEDSTFALLKSSCIPHICTKDEFSAPPLVRSKSADSIINNEINPLPLLSQQPSSLSLNDVENLEKDILLETSSVPDIIRSGGSAEEEPEALIVEVEDVVEETASVLDHFMQKCIPVYQKQEYADMCEGETRAAPTIRRSESARAQANYNIIDEIVNILRSLSENEKDIVNIEDLKLNSDSIIIIDADEDMNIKILKTKQKQQKKFCSTLTEKLLLLQTANASISSEDSQATIAKFTDVLDTIQDLTCELNNLGENLDASVFRRNKNQAESDIITSTSQMYPQISDILEIMKNKILELRRNLSYVCAASDMSVSSWKRRNLKRQPATLRKSKSHEEQPRFEKNNSPKTELNRQIEQGAIKKRLRYRQKGVCKTLDDSDEEEVVEQRKPKRKVRSQNSADSNKSFEKPEAETENIEVDPEVVEKVVVPTKSTNFANYEDNPTDTPVTVFIKTTRKLFTPIAVTPEENVAHLPPLHASPTPQRKATKEISPNIRLMVVKYNQKISEETAGPKSAGSSGSASPIAWRSPVLERRVKAQTERYQQEIHKMSPLLGGRREVQKSASASVVVSGNKQFTVHKTPEATRGILKSSSVQLQLKEHTKTLSDERSNKLKKAKEDFLNSPLPTPTLRGNELKYPVKNRLSQISVESESSYTSTTTCEGLLVKSASAGMINIDPIAYRQFDTEVHADGYVSLPRSKKNKEGLLSNITSKFRKVKMRRHKMNAVSTLCRQSLVVDINNSEETLSGLQSDETSPSTSRTGSWIRRFKSK